MSMRASRVVAYGGEENLKLETIPVPTVGKNEVLIKVAAAGVNPVDTYFRAGIYSNSPPVPFTPGLDVAGVVEDVGEEVTGFKKGDRVYTLKTTSGGYAEYATAETLFVNHLPDNLSFEEGASIGIPYYTSTKALHFKSQAKAGETVLIHGASGGAGLAAVQLCKAKGMRVVGTAGSKEGMDLVSQTGADLVFNHRDEGYIQAIKDSVGGVDIIMEMLANVNLQTDLEILNFNGRAVVIGCRGNVEINPRLSMMKELSIIGVGVLFSSEEEYKQMHSIVYAGLSGGWLKPRVSKVYPLGDAGKAHYDIINNQGSLGNLVLDPSV